MSAICKEGKQLPSVHIPAMGYRKEIEIFTSSPSVEGIPMLGWRNEAGIAKKRGILWQVAVAYNLPGFPTLTFRVDCKRRLHDCGALGNWS